jgi:Alginate export
MAPRSPRRFRPATRRSKHAFALGLIGLCLMTRPASADDVATDTAASTAQRPRIGFYRWQEDWSALVEPALRTEPFDTLKYIPLSFNDPHSYVSLGINLRERFESNDAPSFGVGKNRGDTYLLHRFQIHADVHPDANWQIFAQLEDVRAGWKATITPVDENRLDLRQATVAYNNAFAIGSLKVKVGRQEIGFDLERFVSVRDGPNVRQAFDAIWADWEMKPWRVTSFWSHPVQYRSHEAFDDFSNGHFQYGGFRVERDDIGPGKLSAYYSRFDLDGAKYLDAAGDERRDIVDVGYAGALAGFDWDLETMGQGGSVGNKTVRAWAAGALAGYTLSNVGWTPRFGLQLDAATGDRHRGDGELETFNPLFPNGYYFTLAGYTSYVNLIHVKPSITVKPTRDLTLLAAVGLQWRQTTADAVYVQPNIPVAGTAGTGHLWTGAYAQVRGDWAISPNLSGAIEAVHFKIGDTIRRAGGHDSDYLGVELKFGW